MLIVEFYHESIKHKMLDKKAKEKLLSFNANHEFYKYYIIEEKTQKQRETNKALSVEVESKNHDLQAQGNTEDVWVVRNYGLFKKKKRASPPGM